MSDGQSKQKIIHVFVDEQFHRRLKVNAATSGRTIAEVVREAVVNRLDAMDREQASRPRRQPADLRSIEP